MGSIMGSGEATPLGALGYSRLPAGRWNGSDALPFNDSVCPGCELYS